MIKITAKIKVYDDSDGIIDKSDVQDVVDYANISATPINEIVNEVEGDTYDYFTLADENGNGGSALDGDSIFALDSVDYYISNTMTGSTQESDLLGSGYTLSQPIDIVVEVGSDNKLPNKITIVFDETQTNFATRVGLIQSGSDETQIINHYTTLQIYVENQTSNITIRIYALNKPYSQLTITAMRANFDFEIDGSRMINCEFALNEKANETLPSFGVISNDGSIEFRDYDESFLRLIEQGKFHDKKNVTFYLENTYDRTKMPISTFLSDSVSYDDDSQTANISLADNLVAWQDVKKLRIYMAREWVSSAGIAWQIPIEKTMKDVYDALVGLTPSSYSFAELDDEMIEYLESIVLKYFTLKTDTLWNQWSKFCNATATHLYINKDNEIAISKILTTNLVV